MTAQTSSTKRIPYVTANDEQRDFPTHSRQLAERLDAIIPADGKLLINGTLYEASGTVSTIPRFTFTYSQGGVHAGSFNMPNPFTPPPGWKFFWAVDHSTGFTFISPCGHTAAHTILRVMQLGNNDSRALQKVKYWLVKA